MKIVECSIIPNATTFQPELHVHLITHMELTDITMTDNDRFTYLGEKLYIAFQEFMKQKENDHENPN
jgi:hypothetical protein